MYDAYHIYKNLQSSNQPDPDNGVERIKFSIIETGFMRNINKISEDHNLQNQQKMVLLRKTPVHLNFAKPSTHRH